MVNNYLGAHKRIVAISAIETLSEVEVDSDSAEMKAALKGVATAGLVLPSQMGALVET